MLPTIVQGIIAVIEDVLEEDYYDDKPPDMPDLSPSMWANYHASIILTIEELLSLHNRRIAKLKDAAGPQTTGETFDIIAAKFARRSDVDSCKMWMDQMARYMQAAMSEKHDVGKHLEQLVRVLKTPLQSNK